MSEAMSAADYAAGQLGNTSAAEIAEQLMSGAGETVQGESPLPVFTVDLLQHLENGNPERVPHRGEDNREFYIYLGRRQLIGELKRQLESEKGDE